MPTATWTHIGDYWRFHHMRRLPLETRAKILGHLTDGVSVRATARLVGVDVNSVMRLTITLGQGCKDFQDRTLVELNSERIEVDEIWTYVFVKEDNLRSSQRGKLGYGDHYVWLAIDPDTKLVPCCHVGKRTAGDAQTFMNDLAPRFNGRILLSSDAFPAYAPAVQEAFGTEVDFAHLMKVFKKEMNQMTAADFLNKRRYQQPVLEATKRVPIFGNPDLSKVSTSGIERFNATVRLSLRRMSRAQFTFSKSFEHLKASMALLNMFYNFGRIHRSLRCTPAMQAGITDHVWSLEEIAALEPTPVVNRPKTYKKAA